MRGELDDVRPLDDAELMDAANPVQPDGTIEFDERANTAREAGMVQRLLDDGPVVIFVLGGDHDLRDELKAACPDCAVTVLTPRKFEHMNVAK